MRYRAGVLRCAPVASFAPAHVASGCLRQATQPAPAGMCSLPLMLLRAALRQGWFAFLPECLTLRATHVAYRTNPACLVPSQRPLACVRVNPPPRALLLILSS